MKLSLHNPYAKIIFLNKNLYEDFKYKSLLLDKFSIIHNGVDLELFEKDNHKNKKEIIFVGNLRRFGESRDLEFIIDSILKIKNGFVLKVVGATKNEITELQKKYCSKDFDEHIKIIGRLSRIKTMQHIITAEVGLLINSDKNLHSTKYTSPIKYFEYLGAGLKVLAVDFDSHRKLPFAENIVYFRNNDFLSFKKALNIITNLENKSLINRDMVSLENRVNKILKLAEL
jgi:glycosyltransferase involved in cell wall biosynthesis